jgi:hypothetical protein
VHELIGLQTDGHGLYFPTLGLERDYSIIEPILNCVPDDRCHRTVQCRTKELMHTPPFPTRGSRPELEITGRSGLIASLHATRSA